MKIAMVSEEDCREKTLLKRGNIEELGSRGCIH